MDVKFIALSNTIISKVLCKILNLCTVSREFPDAIKIAEVVPIYKRGDPLESSNYRPISLLSNFCKSFEKESFQQTYSFLTKNYLVSSKQFGFQQIFSLNHTMRLIHDNL